MLLSAGYDTIRARRQLDTIDTVDTRHRIYIAGPYSLGDREANAWAAVAVADRLMSLGYAPFCPHLTHWWSIRHAHDYEDWLALDFAFLSVCDALIRLPGESPGVDREVAFAKEHGIPVYYGIAAFLEAKVTA